MQNEKRCSERYKTDAKIRFSSFYDFDTKVKYTSPNITKKCFAQSINVSVEGISFVSDQLLENGEQIDMDVFIPTSENAIHMEGEVRWSRKMHEESEDQFNTGVKLLTVEGEPVHDSIYFDEEYNVEWSVVLEKILGEYSKIVRERRKDG